MTIILDDKYRIEDEPSCWSLIYEVPTGKVSPTTGQPTFSRETSYHMNLRQALTKYSDDSLKGSSSLVEVVERLNGIEQRIEKVLTEQK